MYSPVNHVQREPRVLATKSDVFNHVFLVMVSNTNLGFGLENCSFPDKGCSPTNEEDFDRL